MSIHDMTSRLMYWWTLLLVFSVPWQAISVPGFGSISRLVGLLAVVAWIGSKLLSWELRRPSLFHYMFLMLVLMSLLSIYWTYSLEHTFARTQTYIELFVFSLIIWDTITTYPRLRMIMYAYILGCYVSIGSLLWNFARGIGAEGLVIGRYTAFGFNVNELGIMLAIGLPISIYLSTSGNDSQESPLLAFLGYLYLPFSGMAILLTGSRAATVAGIVGFTLVFLIIPRMKLRNVLVIGLVFVLFGLVLWPMIPANSIERIATAQDEVANANFGGRGAIWSQGIDAFIQHPILGVGSGAFAYYISLQIVSHNTHLSILTELGFVGFAIYLCIVMIVTMSAVLQPFRERSLWLVTMAVWFIGSMTTNLEHRKPTWLVFTLIISSYAIWQSRAVWRQSRATV